MSEMMKRVAEAIRPYLEDSVSEPEGAAEAAIAALRDPPVRVLVAGKTALFSYAKNPTIEDARNCWEAMIDAALTPPTNS